MQSVLKYNLQIIHTVPLNKDFEGLAYQANERQLLIILIFY